jgi:hypothetical protein
MDEVIQERQKKKGQIMERNYETTLDDSLLKTKQFEYNLRRELATVHTRINQLNQNPGYQADLSRLNQNLQQQID